MSEEYQAPNGELREAYNDAINRGAGRVVANEVCQKHGASAGLHPWRRVPANKARACLAALKALQGARPERVPPIPRRAATALAEVRRETLQPISAAEREAARPKPAKALDPVAIYDRWNNPPPKED